MPLTKLKTTPEYSWTFSAIGTQWEIVTDAQIVPEHRQQIIDLIEVFDRTYSRFRKDSLVATMAKKPGEYTLPRNAEQLFDYYDALWEITEQKVTPMVGELLASAGYDEAYSLKPTDKLPAVVNYREVLQRNGSTVYLKQGALLDIGAVGKGFLIDEVSRMLTELNYKSFTVDGSGDMRTVGAREEVIGLENPFDTTQIIGTVRLSGRALCASASNRRAWGDWHHIVDPVTNQPVRDIIATWVIADSAMIADGLATALFFVSPKTLAQRYTYEYIRMHADGSIEYSDYFSEGIFS